MLHLLFHNQYLRGIGIVFLIELVLMVQMVRNRKPGTTRSAAFLGNPNSLAERGLWAKKWCDVFSAIALLWIVVAIVAKAVMPSG
jgi:hypothetical protein